MRAFISHGTIVALVAAAIFSMSLQPSAAAEAEPVDASAAAAIANAEMQLRAMGIDPGSAVVQVGALNYAGPDCPGSDWNCTTAMTVIQVGWGYAYAQNFAECTDLETAANSCTITQTGAGDNIAHCVLRFDGSVAQTCNITQTNTAGPTTTPGYNYALVDQLIKNELTVEGAGTGQGGNQMATVKQENGGGTNSARILQRIEFKAHASGTSIGQDQNAMQTLILCQGAVGCPVATTRTGANVAHVEQSQYLVLSAEGDSVDQTQNFLSDGPDTSADITQQSGSGKADSTLIQKHVLEAKATGAPANQTQGSLSGGLMGLVNQSTSGVKTSIGKLEEVQKLQGPAGSTQVQFGPEFCCSTQSGSSLEESRNDSVDIDMASIQTADDRDTQESKLVGTCTTNGKCKVEQKVDQNGVAFTPVEGQCEESGPETNCNAQVAECVGAGSEGSLCASEEGPPVLFTCPPSCSVPGLSRSDPAGLEIARLAPRDWIIL